MAFRRLRVERSLGLTWFGAVIAVFAFAAAQATSDGKFWRPSHIGAVGVLYTLGMLLGAYCIFRGLHGEWWRVISVDVKARTIKTWSGEVVRFDQLGTLTISDGALQSESGTTLYRAIEPELRQVKVMLEAVVRPAQNARLVRLHRLAIDRSPTLFVFTLVGFAVLIGVFIAESHTLARSFFYEPEFKLMWLLGFLTCIAWFRLALFGSYMKKQLRVDPVVGVLQLEDGTLVPFEELGDLTIKQRSERTPGGRGTVEYHELHATGVKGVLYSNIWGPKATQRRLDALSTARLQHDLRRALEAPLVEGDAFRSGIDPGAEAQRIAGDSPYRAAALEALTHDPDPTVRARATALLRG